MVDVGNEAVEQAQRGEKGLPGARLTEQLLRSRRDLNNGFGESLARAFELAFTPAIFAFLGYLLDRAAGTTPLFTVVFFLGVAVYVTWKMFRRYDADMQAEERKLHGPRQESPAP